jgi:hypothetical protein
MAVAELGAAAAAALVVKEPKFAELIEPFILLVLQYFTLFGSSPDTVAFLLKLFT